MKIAKAAQGIKPISNRIFHSCLTGMAKFNPVIIPEPVKSVKTALITLFYSADPTSFKYRGILKEVRP